jgi:MFS family permease
MTTSRTNRLLLINAALGSFLAGTASRIFAVALPTVASSLETTIVGISWAVIAYQISQISLSLVFGRIGDIYGRRTIFGMGLIVSAIGALLCGFSQNVTQLILFRLFHGVGASMTQSQARALAMDSLPKESSGKAQGFMTTAFHSGVLVGPSVGGLIIDYIHWRAVFFFLAPIAVAGIVLTWINRESGTFGISLGTLLLTAAYRYYTGDPTATPTPANPTMFVRAMNFTFSLGGMMALVAMFCSAMRGERRTLTEIAEVR